MKDSSFFVSIKNLFIIIFIFCFIISILFIPTISRNNNIYTSDSSNGNSNFIWPLKNNYTITSSFGKRISPTAGASIFHKGIDISAPEHTELLAVCDGTITFTDFLGGGRIYNNFIKFRIY